MISIVAINSVHLAHLLKEIVILNKFNWYINNEMCEIYGNIDLLLIMWGKLTIYIDFQR